MKHLIILLINSRVSFWYIK